MFNHSGVGSFAVVDSENTEISDQIDLTLVEEDAFLKQNTTKVTLVC